MSMKLQSRVSKRELEAALADECDFQFDFLAGISQLIIRMDEVHPSLDNNNDRYLPDPGGARRSHCGRAADQPEH
jgi:hypothetical protein